MNAGAIRIVTNAVRELDALAKAHVILGNETVAAGIRSDIRDPLARLLQTEGAGHG